MRRLLPLVLALPALIGCIDLDGIWFNGTQLDEYKLPFNEVPDDQLEEVELAGTSTDDEGAPTLFGHWAHPCPEAAQGGDCGTPRDDVKILYFHGNFHSNQEYWDRVQTLWRMGYSVFALDYRGYGKSTGTSTEAGFYADGLDAYAHVRERMDDDDSLIIYGFSIGSAIATEVARLEAHDAFILEAPLASGQAFMDDAIGVGFEQSVLVETRFDNLAKIPEIDTPKLVAHGRTDDFVRFEFGELLFDAAEEPKQFFANEGAHGTVPCPARDPAPIPSELACEGDADYIELIDAFVANSLELELD